VCERQDGLLSSRRRKRILVIKTVGFDFLTAAVLQLGTRSFYLSILL